jgi:hypothetical protein
VPVGKHRRDVESGQVTVPALDARRVRQRQFVPDATALRPAQGL